MASALSRRGERPRVGAEKEHRAGGIECRLGLRMIRGLAEALAASHEHAHEAWRREVVYSMARSREAEGCPYCTLALPIPGLVGLTGTHVVSGVGPTGRRCQYCSALVCLSTVSVNVRGMS